MFELVHVAKIGIVAGIVMGMAAMILNLLKFTKLDLTTYMGSLITGKPSGPINFIAGFTAHIFASAALAIVYDFFIVIFQIPLTLYVGLIAGILHTFISGTCMIVFDNFNRCVQQGTVAPLGFLASNYGLHAVLTFFATHIIYAIIVIKLLS